MSASEYPSPSPVTSIIPADEEKESNASCLEFLKASEPLKETSREPYISTLPDPRKIQGNQATFWKHGKSLERAIIG